MTFAPDCPVISTPNGKAPSGQCYGGMNTFTTNILTIPDPSTGKTGRLGLSIYDRGEYKVCVYAGVKNDTGMSLLTEKDAIAKTGTFKAGFANESTSINGTTESSESANNSAARLNLAIGTVVSGVAVIIGIMV
ncbi:hypothetical protein VNI00_017064 [Paramarasmius palmivorus]|uniref:Uncharacterized protein n=1 Tax=Paramarasmius palmivorus TaxID=297713 RepID=A0AAW0B8P4_9AGAR